MKIKKEVAKHLGKLKKGFDCGDLEENNLSNADYTHFKFNMDIGGTLATFGDREVKYAVLLQEERG